MFFKYDGYFSREADDYMTAVYDAHDGPWVCSSGTGRALCCGTSKLRCLRTAMYIVDGRRTRCRTRPLGSTETPAALRVILPAKGPHHDLGFYGKKGFERESTRIGDFVPAGPVPLFPQGCLFIPAGLSLYSRRAGPLFPQG